MIDAPEPKLGVPPAERRVEPASRATAASPGRGLVDELAVLREVLQSFVSLQVARSRVALERSGLALARLALLGVAAVVLVAATVVLVVVGSVGGVAAATGWPWWLAALALGIVGPLIAAAVVQLALARRDAKRARALEARAKADGSHT